MSGCAAAGADPEKPHTVHNGRVPKQSQEEEDIEAQESVGTASDGSGDSTDIPVEGGMTVAFKVCLPSLLATARLCLSKPARMCPRL